MRRAGEMAAFLLQLVAFVNIMDSTEKLFTILT